jgi:hypothetical protein
LSMWVMQESLSLAEKQKRMGSWFRTALSIEWLFVFWCGRKLHLREKHWWTWAKLHSSPDLHQLED